MSGTNGQSIAELIAENDGLRAANAELHQRVLVAEKLYHIAEQERVAQVQVLEALKAELDVLKRHVFGKRSQKMPNIQGELQRKKNAKPDPNK